MERAGWDSPEVERAGRVSPEVERARRNVRRNLSSSFDAVALSRTRSISRSDEKTVEPKRRAVIIDSSLTASSPERARQLVPFPDFLTLVHPFPRNHDSDVPPENDERSMDRKRHAFSDGGGRAGYEDLPGSQSERHPERLAATQGWGNAL